MRQRRPVLSSRNGNIESPVVFIAEAPGRLGADKYNIPLYGDQTGRNFNWLISQAGMSREFIFITNAVLCNPRKIDGNNDSPKKTEIHNCSIYLKEILDIIQPKLVVPLGKVALDSLKLIHPKEIELRDSVGQEISWNGYHVFPLFHPGPRAFIWRSKTQQMNDYIQLKELLVRSK
jgi:uracil-DNA glycosylase